MNNSISTIILYTAKQKMYLQHIFQAMTQNIGDFFLIVLKIFEVLQNICRVNSFFVSIKISINNEKIELFLYFFSKLSELFYN